MFRTNLLIPGSVLAITIVMVILLSSTNGHAADLDWKDLLAGEVLVEAIDSSDGLPGVKASFVVKAEPEAIWATLIDYDNFTDIFKGMDKVRVLEQDQNGAKVEFWLSIFWNQYHYVLYRNYINPGRKMTWQRVSGDLERIEGVWEIQQTPRADAQLIVYESYVDPGDLIPTRLVRWRGMDKAHNMAIHLREWIVNHPLQDNAE